MEASVGDRQYIPGDFYRMDDRTGFKVRASQTRQQWNGRYVREESWEERQPQDLVRGTHDSQVVADPRPRKTDVFTGPLQTVTTQASPAGSHDLWVTSSLRFLAGDRVTYLLQDGTTVWTYVSGTPTQGRIVVTPQLVGAVAAGSPVTNMSAVSTVVA